MNVELLEKARAKVPSVPVLVNMISRRMREYNEGKRPLVKPLGSGENKEDSLDTVLREIGEGKLISEVDFNAIVAEK